MAYALWIIQTLLGLLFLFSGSMKFVMSVADMTKDMPAMPGWFLHFIGVMEILGGFGLILPSFLRIRPGLTPLAAACLVIIMSGATAITLGTMGIGRAMLPLIVGILCVFVAYGRWRLAPLSPRS